MALECKCITKEDKTLIMESLIEKRNIVEESKEEFERVADNIGIFRENPDLHERVLKWHRDNVSTLNRIHSEISNIKTCKQD